MTDGVLEVQLTSAQMAMMAGTGLQASMVSSNLGKFSSHLFMCNGKVKREEAETVLDGMAKRFDTFASQLRAVLGGLEEAPPAGDGTPLVAEDILGDVEDMFKGGA